MSSNIQPKLSIIVPIYNVEKYLRRCLDSLVHQSIKEIELILVNDGSPDGSHYICDEYAAKDPRVKIIHKENGGLGYARNSGLEIATGKYVAFVDSDDYVSLDMYEKLYNYAESYKSDVVFCGFKKEVAENKWVDCIDHRNITVFEDRDQVRDLGLEFIASKPNSIKERNYSMSVWHSIYNLDLIKRNNLLFPSEREVVSEDLPFQVDIFNHASKVLFVPEVLYFHCLNGASLSNTFLVEKYSRYHSLYGTLMSKVSLSLDDRNRVNKLFIGYVRSYIFKLVNSSLSREDKMKILCAIIDDKIWTTIGLEYKFSYLTLMPRMIYRSILNKNSRLLYRYAYFLSKVKKLTGK